MSVPQYEVFITPLFDENRYADEVSVSDYDIEISNNVLRGTISSISRQVDDGDYDIGIFTYGSLNVKIVNYGGSFNAPASLYSMFPYSRDLAKVKIVFYDSTGATTTVFNGLIDDRATREHWQINEVWLKVLSNDAILDKVLVTGGTVTDGMMFSQAIKAILNKPQITRILNFSVSDVNVSFDAEIDIGVWFDGKSSKECLDQLLLASNSVMVIDGSNNIIVKNRDENSGSAHEFYGQNDLLGRENIADINNYNTGQQRAFNQVVVNDDYITTHQPYVDLYGLMTKELSFEFITSGETCLAISEELVDTFAQPRAEMELTVETNENTSIEMYDKVTVNYGGRITGYRGQHIPILGTVNSGDTVFPYHPQHFEIYPETVWKVIGIDENTTKLEKTLKLREIGNATLSRIPT